MYGWAQRQAKVFVLFVSRAWFLSGYCQGEWLDFKAMAAARRAAGDAVATPLVVLLDGAPVPEAALSGSRRAVFEAAEAVRMGAEDARRAGVAPRAFWERELEDERLVARGGGAAHVLDLSDYFDFVERGSKTSERAAARQIRALAARVRACAGVGDGCVEAFRAEREALCSMAWLADARRDDDRGYVRNCAFPLSPRTGRLDPGHRLNLNTADADALASKVPAIGKARAEQIIAARDRRPGQAFEHYEDLFSGIQGLTGGFDTENVENLLPFVCLPGRMARAGPPRDPAEVE